MANILMKNNMEEIIQVFYNHRTDSVTIQTKV